jgi:serine protease Do
VPRSRRAAALTTIAAVALVVSACSQQAAPSVSSAATPAASAAASQPASGAVGSLDAVKTATIQIEAQGTFQDPEVGTVYNAAGRGSGFIVDPSGIAVTNNHVVTGAALLQVWVGGEDEPRNARVLGVSECSDLAVIDIDGEGYPYLDWYTDAVTTGLDVYAAGFPLGDPEFTLTRGIVSKESADGETSWASVDDVIEHDATINPGNSGGPLVTGDGKVVGVNYAGASSTNQYFAINGEAARSIVETMRAGSDVHSIGVNGQAVTDGQSISGIWVASVKSGSPADTAGIQGGDIITTLEGLVLSTDGTMADYCDILRTHDASDTLAVEVLRFATEEYLVGQLNGRPLEPSIVDIVDDEVDGGGGGSTTYDEYVTVQDDTGAMVMSVPAEWSDTLGDEWQFDGQVVGRKIVAAPDLNSWYETWDTPGVFFGASSTLAGTIDVAGMLDANSFEGDCTLEGRDAYEDPLYTGQYDFYTNCGGEGGSTFVVLAAEPADGSFIMLLQIILVSDADVDALDQVLNTFVVVGTP